MLAQFVATALAVLLAALVPSEAASAPEQPDEIVGETVLYVARYEDTMPRLAHRFGLGFVELMAANPEIDPWLPSEGREVVIPSAHLLPDGPRKGIVINLAELRLYYFRRNGSVLNFPVGIGRAYWETPEIETVITRKRKDPVWHPPASIRSEHPELPAQVEPGPDNPLGAFAMDLGYDAYVIHGTNKPLGVGRRVSHGCIRLYPEDIAALFGEVRAGMPVRIIDQETKLGWSDGALFLEAHPSQEQADEIEAGKTPSFRVDLPGLMIRLLDVPGATDADLDWALIEQTLLERRGVPIQISPRARATPAPPADTYFRSDSR